MADREALWHLKIRVIFLASGDENTKFFHAYARGRKVQNTIWEMKDGAGEIVSSFEGLAKLGVEAFQSLFKAPTGSSLAEIIQLAQTFPLFAEEEENSNLMDELKRCNALLPERQKSQA